MKKAFVLAFILMFGLSVLASAMSLNYLGSFDPPSNGWVFDGIIVGGISGLTLAPDGSFYGVCDDKGANVDPPGILYKLNIDFSLNGIEGVSVLDIVQLRTPDGSLYSAGSIDAEDVLWTPKGFIVSSERDLGNNPWVRTFTLDGKFVSEIPIPDKFIPLFDTEERQVRGVRENLSFEASAITSDYTTLFVMNEQALVQDGGVSTPESGTPVRLLKYDLSTDSPVVIGEFVYITEPMFGTPPEGKFGDNGVPGMVYVGHLTSEFDLIVMERSYVPGQGNQIGLFGVNFDTGAKVQLLIISDNPELTDVLFDPDNMEAIALGPQLSNGNYSLIIASDNNFNPKYQRNVFAAFEIVLGE